MEDVPETNQAKGEPTSMKEQFLHAGAAMLQNFDPPKQLCAHLHVSHHSNPYVSEPFVSGEESYNFLAFHLL